LARNSAKSDPRLLGTWRSDRRRTFKHFKPKANCPPRSIRKLKALFGKLVVKWDRGLFHTELDGHCTSTPYVVLGSDSVSVVIRSKHSLFGEERLQHIHFEGDCYWIALPGGQLCEFFRRVQPE
jgi:hypothetical protein